MYNWIIFLSRSFYSRNVFFFFLDFRLGGGGGKPQKKPYKRKRHVYAAAAGPHPLPRHVAMPDCTLLCLFPGGVSKVLNAVGRTRHPFERVSCPHARIRPHVHSEKRAYGRVTVAAATTVEHDRAGEIVSGRSALSGRARYARL